MDNIDVKNELFSNHRTVSFCNACLSTDRVLSAVTEYVDIFRKFCDGQPMISPSEANLCWECIALIRKVRMFTRKVAEAQKILQFCMMNKQAAFPHSLSRLATSQINTNQIKLIYEEKEVKAIKQELDLDDHFNNFDNYDYSANDVKEEQDNKQESSELKVLELKIDDAADVSAKDDKSKEFNLKRNAKRQAKYRFINTKLKTHRGYLIRNVPIDVNEVLPSLEQERKSSSFAMADYKCVNCVEIFDDREEVVKHNKRYHDVSVGSLVCHICRARCDSEDNLLRHERAHLVRRECRVCGVAACAPDSARRHVDTHHRMVQCLACRLFYKNVRLFYDHYKAMHSRFVCDVCGKRCKSRDVIIKHLRYHFGYECPYCKKKLKNSSSYNNHIECQHTESFSDNAYCVQCDRRFKNDKLYKRHLQASSAHAKERDNNRTKRRYPCPECNKVYSRRTYMNNHYRHVHSKQSKHYCEDCDRHFLNRTRYVDHRRFKHEGAQRDKDKLCNICGRGFAANRTLINHIRTHSGERPFACEHCGVKFTQKHAMVSHVKYIHLKSRRKPSWHECGH